MNFQTNRVDPIQFEGEEPTDFDEFDNTPSPDNDLVTRPWRYVLAFGVFLSILLVLSLSVGYWFRFF